MHPYLDDLLICSDSEAQARKNTETVIACLRAQIPDQSGKKRAGAFTRSSTPGGNHRHEKINPISNSRAYQKDQGVSDEGNREVTRPSDVIGKAPRSAGVEHGSSPMGTSSSKGLPVVPQTISETNHKEGQHRSPGSTRGPEQSSVVDVVFQPYKGGRLSCHGRGTPCDRRQSLRLGGRFGGGPQYREHGLRGSRICQSTC